MTLGEAPAPVPRTLRTTGVLLLVVMVCIGFSVAVYRFLFGLAAVTNLDQQHPWGLWIAVDVATGVALAAGGFTTAAIVYVFHRDQFHALARPALLTALLGYTFVGLGLMVDLGRYYNIWHPIIPTMWQGNSVLFEVGLCVVCYLTVLYIEFLPVVCEKFMSDRRFPRLQRISTKLHQAVNRTMFVFILAGVVLSCLHQSSLGNLLVIAPTKVHPLWNTPIQGLLFLLSAIAVGFPMVIVESLAATWALRLPPERNVLSSMGRYVPPILGIYLAFKIGDMAVRESYRTLADGSFQSAMFMAEVMLGVVLPIALLLSSRIRSRSSGLFIAALLVVLGVALNRINVFLVAYQPPYATRTYVPSLGEVVVTIGLMAALILAYRIIVTFLPVIHYEPHVRSA